MENKPPLNRDLIIPIVIGGISIIGIIVALLFGRLLSSPPQVPMTPSATPFEFIFLGTEPAITTPLVEGSEIATLPEDSSEPTLALVPLTSTSPAPPLILTQPNSTGGGLTLVFLSSTPGGLPTVRGVNSATATVGTTAPPGTYDDNDPRFVYSGNWIPQTNVPEAYQGTLHISNTLGDIVTFTFTGSEIHLFYQAAPSLGSIAITIGTTGPPPFSQADNETQIKEWSYVFDTVETHSVTISHFGGGSVNIDSIFVPGPTPTPTRTATSTQ